MPFSRDDGGNEWVAADDFQTETASAFGHFKPNAAKAEDAEGLALELRALQGFLVPFSGVHGGVGGGQLAGESEHEADSELGNRDGVGARRVHHHDAAAGGGFRIHVVNAYAGAANDAKLRRVLHERVVDLHGGAHHDGVGVTERGVQPARLLVRQLVVRHYFPAGLRRKHGQRGRGHLFRQNNLHCFSLVGGRRRVLVEADAFLFAQHFEHAHDGRVRLAFAALVLPYGVRMHAQPLSHLVLKEVELLARDDEFFAET